MILVTKDYDHVIILSYLRHAVSGVLSSTTWGVQMIHDCDLPEGRMSHVLKTNPLATLDGKYLQLLNSSTSLGMTHTNLIKLQVFASSKVPFEPQKISQPFQGHLTSCWGMHQPVLCFTLVVGGGFK